MSDQEWKWKGIWDEGRRFALDNQWRFEIDNSVIGANVDDWNPYSDDALKSYIWTSGFFCAVSALLAAQVDALKMGVTV